VPPPPPLRGTSPADGGGGVDILGLVLSEKTQAAFRPVTGQLEFSEIEHRILEKWDAERTFDELRRRNQAGPRYSFIDGPITANNPMGVHHAWGRTLKDIWQRYQAMLGRDQRYQNGFDCQGLWVEVEVEKSLGLNSKPEIEKYGLDRFSRACRDRVAHFAGVQTQQSRRLGQWMDWDRSYFTMTDVNISYIWSFLAECHKRGWLYRGHQSMPWCARCGTSLSQHELIDSYETVPHPSLYVSFPLRDKHSESLVVWTTTPWTLPANVAVAVKPDATYVRLQTQSGVIYAAEARLPQLPVTGEVLDRVTGQDLIGLEYEGPFDQLDAQAGVKHRVVGWEEVSLEEGSGLVHIAPGCGQEDFQLAQREDLKVLPAVDEMGQFLPAFGWLHGMSTEKATPLLIDDLGQRGRIVDNRILTHRYPVCWRCGTELIYRVVDEWFIRSTEIRQPMIDASRKVTWDPPQYGKRMEDWLRNMGDWCISRKRYWGLPLPFYFCPQGHLNVIGSEQELRSRAVQWKDIPELHRPWIDEIEVCCSECDGQAERILDVGDCWLDAGVVPFSTLGWRNKVYQPGGYAKGAGEGLTRADLPDHAYWEKWFPADWICEMREQIRLWFYSMLFMGLTLVGESPYRRVLAYEKVNDETGRPMHKSWGNAIWFDDAVEDMGADVMRWAYAGQDPAQNLNFGYGPARDIKRRLLTLWNTYSFFVLYASIDGYRPEPEVLTVGPDLAKATDLDRWMLARTEDLVRRCGKALDAYDSPTVVRVAESYFDDLSNWYVRLSRPRFWKSEDDADKRSAYDTLWYSLSRLVRCLAPIIPFLTEELWGNLVAGVCPGSEPSVHLTRYPEPRPEARDEVLLAEMAATREVIEVGRAIRAETGIKTRQPLSAMVLATHNQRLHTSIQRFTQLIQTELNVKEVVVKDSTEDFARAEVFLRPEILGPKYGAEFRLIKQAAERGEYQIDGGTARVGTWTLLPEEFEVRTRAREGYATSDGRDFALALDTEITPELELEGRVRELIRLIQNLRREADLQMTDRIVVTYPDEYADVFSAHREWIMRETLATAANSGTKLAIAGPEKY
jgi:isoleucyl-tRNA synthetase